MTKRLRKSQPQSWQNRYYTNGLSTSADQAEWQAVLHGVAHISTGTLDDEMSESADQDTYPTARTDDLLQGTEVVREAIQGSVAEILFERKKLLGDAYPFTITNNSLVYQAPELPIYALLLGICQAPSLTAAPYYELPRIFETLSVLAGRGYVGQMAQGYKMGWPRPTDMARFKIAIEDLRTKSGNFGTEWQWSPAEHLPNDPSPKFVKEDGLDVVVWNQWPDGRTGQLYLLGQCACGNDWLTKDKELDLNDLRQWFHLPRVKPVRSFFTPRYAVAAILNELSYKAGLVFDRVRMMHALIQPHMTDDVNLHASHINKCLNIAKQPLAPAP